MNKTTPEAIVKARKAIDKIDEKILYLLKRRVVYAEKIGQSKAEHGLHIDDIKREERLFERLEKANEGALPDDKLFEVWEKIIELSKTFQEN